MDILAMLKECDALLEGHFKLTSGRHSNRYIEKIRLINQPRYVKQLCAQLAKQVQDWDFDIVVGPAMGGIVLAYEIARELDKPFVFTQREQGQMMIRSGFPVKAGQRCLIVEDIVTTGGSVFEVIECLKQRNLQAAGVGLIVDRSGGKVDFNVPTTALLQLDIESWEPDACPLCQANVAINTPGSSAKK